MSAMIPALIFAFANHRAGIMAQQPTSVPDAVILLGGQDKVDVTGVFKAVNKIIAPHRFEQFENDLLAFRAAQGTCYFVQKTFPPYAKLRFRKHALGLYLKYGLGQPFPYSELAPQEFKPFADAIWRHRPDVVPNEQTKISFQLLLRSTGFASGRPQSIEFGPGVQFTDLTFNTLKQSPADVLTSRDQIIKRRAELSEPDQGMLFRPLVDMPTSVELSMSKDAIERFREYYDSQVGSIDQKVDDAMTDPTWRGTKARRKSRSMRDLKTDSPVDFQTFLTLSQDLAKEAGTPLSPDEVASLQESNLTSQYELNIVLFAGTKRLTMVLPM